jgi:hypothetical protein
LQTTKRFTKKKKKETRFGCSQNCAESLPYVIVSINVMIYKILLVTQKCRRRKTYFLRLTVQQDHVSRIQATGAAALLWTTRDSFNEVTCIPILTFPCLKKPWIAYGRGWKKEEIISGFTLWAHFAPSNVNVWRLYFM